MDRTFICLLFFLSKTKTVVHDGNSHGIVYILNFEMLCSSSAALHSLQDE